MFIGFVIFYVVINVYNTLFEFFCFLQEKSCVVQCNQGQHIIKIYNAFHKVLIHYEIVYHQAWCKHVPRISSLLAHPLLIKHPRTLRIHVGLDPLVGEAIREAYGMWRLGLSVPHCTQLLALCKDRLQYVYNTVQSLVERNNRIR